MLQQLMVNSHLPDQQKQRVNLIKVQFLEKEISIVTTLCFSATSVIHILQKKQKLAFSLSLLVFNS